MRGGRTQPKHFGWRRTVRMAAAVALANLLHVLLEAQEYYTDVLYGTHKVAEAGTRWATCSPGGQARWCTARCMRHSRSDGELIQLRSWSQCDVVQFRLNCELCNQCTGVCRFVRVHGSVRPRSGC
jgi:hypothetical protein